MKQEVKVFDFDLAVREQYEAVVAGATMQMSGWEDEEPAAIRRILRSPERANRFLESLERVNRFVEEELLRYPPTKATHQLLNQMAKYYSCCAVFCAIWLSRNALKVYLHDQKRLPGTPETTAEDILSATEDPQGLLSSLYSLYHVLYNCPRDELIADYRGVVEEFLEDYLDICLAVADDPEVRKLRDFLRDFFAYEYQPVMTRPTSWAEYNELPEMKFPELAARWKEAVLSYSISFARRQPKRADHPLTNREFVAYMDEKVHPRARKTARDVAFIRKQNEGDFGEAPKRYQPRLTGVKLKAHRIGKNLICAGFRCSPVANAIYMHFKHNKGFDYKNARTFRESLVRFYKSDQGVTTIRNIEWKATPPIDKLLEHIAKVAREK